MERRLDELSIDVKKIVEHISDIKETLAANTVTLERNTADVAYHIKRTEQLEARVAKVELPFKAARWLVGVVGGLVTVVGAVYGLVKFLGR